MSKTHQQRYRLRVITQIPGIIRGDLDANMEAAGRGEVILTDITLPAKFDNFFNDAMIGKFVGEVTEDEIGPEFTIYSHDATKSRRICLYDECMWTVAIPIGAYMTDEAVLAMWKQQCDEYPQGSDTDQRYGWSIFMDSLYKDGEISAHQLDVLDYE